MRIKTFSSLMSLILLAGCVGEDPPAPPAAEPVEDETTTPARATPAVASASPQGAEAEEDVVTIVGEITQSVSVGIPCPTRVGATDCAAGRMVGRSVEVARGAPERATLTATWTASTPLGETLRFILLPADESAEHAVSGESPLTWEVPPEALQSTGEYKLLVRPATPGATLNEVVEFVLTLEYA